MNKENETINPEEEEKKGRDWLKILHWTISIVALLWVICIKAKIPFVGAL